jgi:hypothetical protein
VLDFSLWTKEWCKIFIFVLFIHKYRGSNKSSPSQHSVEQRYKKENSKVKGKSDKK